MEVLGLPRSNIPNFSLEDDRKAPQQPGERRVNIYRQSKDALTSEPEVMGRLVGLALQAIEKTIFALKDARRAA